nr:preprotein-translocase subunit a [Odontella aurita var. minima]
MLKNPFKKKSIATKYQKIISEINDLETTIKTLTDGELRNKNEQLKRQYNQEQDLNSLIIHSFALTREASLRTLGLRHFDVQLIGGLVLNSGKIAEMRTGEGKTLVATLPASLNALTKNGVHIVTVNEYLANRDQTSMGQIYRFLGLETGLIQEKMTTSERQRNYKADITYVTNNELGFDYLRDNLALNIRDVVLRPFNYCIVDEVDSVLIDEALTPLIIANSVKTCVDKYIIASEITDYLELNVHFEIDEKNKNVLLTNQGTIQIEKILGVQDLYNPRDPWIPYIINAIRASSLFFRDVHYIVQNNRIVIVDEFTGRIMPDRRWSDGLHQAVEAKEAVPIRQTTEITASITYQNFFLVYPKLSGMTGTAKTAEVEFDKIYSLPVEEIPTARPNLRNDLPDFIYKDEFSKWNAIAKECRSISLVQQPILIGTTTVEKSEMLAQLLTEYQLPHQILNAKPENVRRESEIVAQAGKKGSITIATNMAGRGTDIILGGNIQFKVRKDLYNILVSYKYQIRENQKTNHLIPVQIFPLLKKLKRTSQKFLSVLAFLIQDKDFIQLSDVKVLKILNESELVRTPKTNYQCSMKFLVNELLNFEKKSQKLDNVIVKNLGGLYIIGTERNDSRRIDNQLRGRCGRQGDPGKSRFFLSIEDKLIRLFGDSRLEKVLKSQLLDDLPLESELVTKILDSAQTRVEERNYELRKNLFDYDDILNKQRNVVYYERRKVLESESARIKILAYGEQVVSEITNKLKRKKVFGNQIISRVKNLLGTKLLSTLSYLEFNDFDPMDLQIYLLQEFWLSYEAKILELEIEYPGIIQEFERTLILIYMDREWKEHLQKMSLLRDAVGWRKYGQRNPLSEYKEDAYKLFKYRGLVTRHLVIYELLRSSIL